MAVRLPMPSPSDWAQTVRLLVVLLARATLTPFFATSSAPSARMRFTSPETTMRASFVTALVTTYQPLSSAVWPA